MKVRNRCILISFENKGDFEKGNDEKEERLKERGVKKKKRNEKGEKRLESVNGHSILR